MNILVWSTNLMRAFYQIIAECETRRNAKEVIFATLMRFYRSIVTFLIAGEAVSTTEGYGKRLYLSNKREAVPDSNSVFKHTLNWAAMLGSVFAAEKAI